MFAYIELLYHYKYLSISCMATITPYSLISLLRNYVVAKHAFLQFKLMHLYHAAHNDKQVGKGRVEEN